MSTKLSEALKALINSPAARPGPAPVNAQRARSLFADVARQADGRGVGPKPWVTMCAAAAFTVNSPGAVAALYHVATNSPASSSPPPSSDDASASVTAQISRPLKPLVAAELIREVGLKCISFNGIPRSINGLAQFRAQLPPEILSRLATAPSRTPTPENFDATNKRGRALWDSVYAPFEHKLLDRLADSHPDLPVHILHSHYGPLLSDPEGDRHGLGKVGRALTSVVAIACLRAQTGVGPQVLSHVFGLRKAVEDGSFRAGVAEEDEVEGVEWLASDEGCEWILKSVDGVVDVVGEGRGTNFAAGRESKL